MAFKTIEHENYVVEFDTPELYVDNKARRRSGHMTHAMAEFAPNCFIDFNSNCSANRWGGHSPYGWVEYRISRDAGKTYSEPQKLPYSWECFLDGLFMISVEKAVACDDGSIVAICLRNDGTVKSCCAPWATPMYIKSTDEGKTWSEPKELSPYAGRPYAALCRDGVIYVLHHCSPNAPATSPDHVYRIYRSMDNGETFEEYSVLPIDPIGRFYGALLFDAEGKLHAYTYNESAEREMDHAVSGDNGKTWTKLAPCYLEKAIRNPQVALIDGVYILHGRSEGALGFVFYTSENACDWDEGMLLNKWDYEIGQYYSNNLNLSDEQGNFLLVQYSETYNADYRVDVKHIRLRVKRR